MEQRHAYLIMAHNKWDQLEQLMGLLDDSRNDLYLHIDAKVKDFDFDHFRGVCKQSGVYFIEPRLDVRWGTSSQVKTELLMEKAAYQRGYARYHFISGVDLPLKTQDELHAFFDGNDTEYLHFTKTLSVLDYQRLSRYHLCYGGKSRIINKLIYEFDKLQERLKVDRFQKCCMKFMRGGEWSSITHSCVGYLLTHEKQILHMTRMAVNSDECFKQVIIGNSEFYKKCYRNADGIYSDLRFIKWTYGAPSPHILTMADLDEILASDCIFARKFDSAVDAEVIRRIAERASGMN